MKDKELSCCVVACERPLDAQYWDSQWKAKTTGWDLGMPAPPLVSFIDTLENKNASILIPGCGNGYEAEYLLSKGFTDITLIDISETATNILKEKFKINTAINVLCEDFFLHSQTYDVIIEQTFFCALPPYLRQRYVWKMHQLLNPKGRLAGLLFNRKFEADGPPFGGSQSEYEALFREAFQLHKIETATNSIEPRAETELAIEFIKNDISVNLYTFSGMHCGGCKAHVTEIFMKIEEVKNVSISSDFSEVMIVSDSEISIDKLKELISYEENYAINKAI